MAAGNRSGRGAADETGAAAGGLARGSQEGPVRIRPTEGTRGRGPRGTTGNPAPAKVRPGDAPKISGEKSVRRTGATVPVKPTRRSAQADEPLPAAAVDRRRQVIGTDDPKTHTTEADRPPQGSRAGSGGNRVSGKRAKGR
jgi:hypothetical protein